MSQLDEDEIIRQAVREGVLRGREIGKVMGRFEMINEVIEAFPGKLPQSWVDERTEKILSDITQMAKEEAK